MSYRVLVGLALVVIVGVPARAQDAYMELARDQERSPLYHEAVALPGPSSPLLAVVFRIPNSALVFVRDPGASSGEGFLAEAVVTVEVYEGSRRVAEQVWRRRHRAASFDETQRRDADVQGRVTFALPPGRYSYRMIVADAHAEREQRTAHRGFAVPDYAALTAGPPLVVAAWDTTAAGVRVEPVALGGQVPYARSSHILLPVGVPAAMSLDQVQLRYTVARLDPQVVEAVEREWQRQVRTEHRAAQAASVSPVPLVEQPMPIPPGGVEMARGTQAGAAFIPLPATDPETLSAAVWTWPAPQDTLGYLVPLDLTPAAWRRGSYRLAWTLTAGGREITGQVLLQTHWRDQPVSLRDPAVAIRNLAFIEDRRTVRAMLKGSPEEQAAQLRAYWKPRDPTPETERNELMVEYYRRVDVAAEAFRTGTVPGPDGLRTDRARIYILYGPPDEIDRTFPPRGGVEERWTYDDGQQFIFHAPTSLDRFELQAAGSR